MVKTSIEKLAEEIGFDIGTSDDITQAKLLNGLCRGLNNSTLDKHSLEMQLCYIEKALDKNAKNIINIIADFIKNEE